MRSSTDSSRSLWSTDSVLSIASTGSVLSFASLGSSMSTRSLLSHQSNGSVMTAQSNNAVLETRTTGGSPWPGRLVAAAATGIALLSLRAAVPPRSSGCPPRLPR